MMQFNPQFPLYIPSKTRWDTRYTSKYLDYIKVPYRLVIEPQQYKQYLSEVGDPSKLLVMDMSYKDRYELCDDIGMERSTGAGPARNFIWDHSISEGHAWHWTMDDNIRSFRRLNRNERVKVSTGGVFRAMEDFCLRYSNIAMAGPNYYMFAPARQKQPPVVFNTRIYSCNLIRNDVPFRWRGRFNEDTIMSLDMLKAGWCTAQFNAFLQEKIQTGKVKGGNTLELYQDGTYLKSKMMVDVHPDVSRMTWRFGRVHHYVDYSRFKDQKLIRIAATRKEGINEYGMVLKGKTDNTRKEDGA